MTFLKFYVAVKGVDQFQDLSRNHEGNMTTISTLLALLMETILEMTHFLQDPLEPANVVGTPRCFGLVQEAILPVTVMFSISCVFLYLGDRLQICIPSITKNTNSKFCTDIHRHLKPQWPSIFEGSPPKTRSNFQPKQGAPFGFQVDIDIRESRWWFQFVFIFSSLPGGNDPIWLYFSDGLVQPPTRNSYTLCCEGGLLP